MKNLTIAIDGHASTGKSSIAKELAVKYGYIYINSGSMYRAVTLFAIENNLLKLTKTNINLFIDKLKDCLLYTSPSPRDRTRSRMPSSA